MIKELTYLSPAETMFLTAPDTSKVGDLARVTFLDLILRKILTINIEKVEDDKPKDFIYHIATGPNFSLYSPFQHEAIFTKPFQEDDELIFSLKNFIKIVFEEIKSVKEYKLKYVYNHRLSNYFSQNIRSFIFKSKSLNKHGQELSQNISSYLKTFSIEETPNNLDLHTLALALLKMKGNILLLDYLNPDLFLALKEVSQKITPKRENHFTWYDYLLLNLSIVPENIHPFNIMRTSSNEFDYIFNTSNFFDASDSN